MTITPILRCPFSLTPFLEICGISVLHVPRDHLSMKQQGWILLLKSYRWCFELCPDSLLHTDRRDFTNQCTFFSVSIQEMNRLMCLTLRGNHYLLFAFSSVPDSVRFHFSSFDKLLHFPVYYIVLYSIKKWSGFLCAYRQREHTQNYIPMFCHVPFVSYPGAQVLHYFGYV